MNFPGDSKNNGGIRVDVCEVPRAARPRVQRDHAAGAGRPQAYLLRVARGRHAAARPQCGRARWVHDLL